MRPSCGSRARAQVRKHDWIVDTCATCRWAVGGEPPDISSALLIFLLLNLIAGGGKSSSATCWCAFHLVTVFTSTQPLFAPRAISDWKWFLAVEPIATRCENNHLPFYGRKPTRDWIPHSKHLNSFSFKKESENYWLLKHAPPPPTPMIIRVERLQQKYFPRTTEIFPAKLNIPMSTRVPVWFYSSPDA